MKRSAASTATWRRQLGGFMLESLIAMTLFSVGVLALVRTQAFAVTTTSGGKYRLDAAMIASQVVSELWVSGTATNVASFAGTYADNSTSWGKRVTDALPGGSLDIAVVGTEVTLTVRWQAPGESEPHRLQQIANVHPDADS